MVDEMSAATATWMAVSLLITGILAGCVGGRCGTPTRAVPSTATIHSSRPVTLADAKRCLPYVGLIACSG
jgi:hypothetical protein